MALNEIYLKLIDIGESADKLCRQNPHHRCAMHLRDLHTQISAAMLSLSETTRKHIASN
jgi:hypothetical protein